MGGSKKGSWSSPTCYGGCLGGAAITAPSALAENAHSIRADAAGPNNQGNLAVNFKIAGLGDNVTITVTGRA